MKIDAIDPVIRAAFIEGLTLEFLSAPGIGKSSRIIQIAKDMAVRMKMPFGLVTRHLSTFDPTEVAGLQFIGGRSLTYGEDITLNFESAVGSYPALFPGNSDKVFLPDGTVTTIAKHGTVPKAGFIFLDELRQAGHDVQKPTARLMDERIIGDWDLRMFGRWSVIGASNNTEDRSGVNKDLAFITNRKGIYQVETTVQILCNYYEDNKVIHDHAIAYIRAFPQNVISDRVPTADGPFPTPRSFERAARMLKTMGSNGELLVSGDAAEIASGFVGTGSGAEFVGFLRRLEDMVTIEEIVADPAKAKVPERIDVVWAVIQMMIGHVNAENGVKLFKYLGRLPKDMQIIAVSSMMAKAPQLAFEKDYSAWARENKDLLMAAFSADRRQKK